MRLLKNEEQKRTVIKVAITAFIFVIFIFLIYLISLVSKIKNEPVIVSYDSIATIKEVIEYYKSTYISEEANKTDGFDYDIYAKLLYMPYEEDDTSNETYYMNLLTDIARVIYFVDYIIYDDANGLVIKVDCEDGKIVEITINDIVDYFSYMDAQISLKTYEEIEITDFNITSGILNALINNNWNSNGIDFGSRDSIFENYNIYYDEGYRVKVIDNKVYNIVFTKRYGESIVESLNANTDLKTVRAFLGEPTFNEYNSKLIGYKGKDIYIFFTEGEVSVYRIYKGEISEFFELCDELLDESVDTLEFMNLLTYLWPDYAEYDYTTSSVFISYPLKGIEISINNSDKDGILVYNNIRESLPVVAQYLEDATFISRLKIDCVAEAEKRKYNAEKNLLSECEEYYNNLSEEEQERIGSSIYYAILPEFDSNNYVKSIKFVSKIGEQPNRELKDGMVSFLWISERQFVYSKSGKGIYLYDTSDGRVSTLLSGEHEFKLNKYHNGVLTYDDNNTLNIN